MSSGDVHDICARLVDASTGHEVRLELLRRLRTHLDTAPILHAQCPADADALAASLASPVLPTLQLLIATNSDAPHALRRLALDTIRHIPPIDALLPAIRAHIMPTLIDILERDTEDLGVVVVRLMIDMCRVWRGAVDEAAGAFLLFVRRVYQGVAAEDGVVARRMFEAAEEQDRAAAMAANASGGRPRRAGSSSSVAPSVYKLLLDSPGSPLAPPPAAVQARTHEKCVDSFRMLAECPVVVVLLLQSSRRIVPDIMEFMPLVLTFLSIDPQKYIAGKSVGGSVDALMTEFVTAQVKSLSFLAFMVKSISFRIAAQQQQQQQMLDSGQTGAAIALDPSIPDLSVITDRLVEARLPANILRIMRTISRALHTTRKDVIVATRHILQTEHRVIFIPYLDQLLDARLMIGDRYTSCEFLRPIAYSVLADLMHHVRNELTPDQLQRTVATYLGILHDTSLTASIQLMCLKLLLNLVDCIMVLDDKEDAKKMLLGMLETLTEKFATISHCIAGMEQALALERDSVRDQVADSNASQDTYRDTSLASTRHWRVAAPSSSDASASDAIKDAKVILKNMVIGLRSVMVGLRHLNMQEYNAAAGSMATTGDASITGVTAGFDAKETDVFRRLFRNGLACFELYSLERRSASALTPADSTDRRSVAVHDEKEFKEVLEAFVNVFLFIDPAVFQDVFTSEIDHIFTLIVRLPLLISVPQILLANEAVSPGIAGTLIVHLASQLPAIGDDNAPYADTVLKVFKLVFMAITLFPDHNEAVLQPHLVNVILQTLKLSSTAAHPRRYFLLLRGLFRSIGGGRFEALYKEVFPLLQYLLETFNTLLQLSDDHAMKELFVELALTVPVRLSVLLPYLSFLTKPLVFALRSGPDLVNQGLRTLELCIDNLSQDFLDTIFAPVIQDLMMSLWGHLRPAPYSDTISAQTMRILGKMGGRNRRFVEPPPLAHDPFAVGGVSLDFLFNNGQIKTSVVIDSLLPLAYKILDGTGAAADAGQRTHAFVLIRAVIMSLVDFDTEVVKSAESFALALQGRASAFVHAQIDMDGSSTGTAVASQAVVSTERRRKRENILKDLLYLTLVADSLDSIDGATEFREMVCRYFTLLLVFGQHGARRHGSRIFSNPAALDPNVFIDALIRAQIADRPALRHVAESNLIMLFDICVGLLGSSEAASKLAIFRAIPKRLCSVCFQENWNSKRGGCAAISFMCKQMDLGTQWMLDHELDFVRALLFVLKDSPAELTSTVLDDASHTISHILKVCNRPDEEDEGNPARRSKFFNLMHILITELYNSSAVVRKTVQDTFQLLADLKGCEVTELFIPVRERLAQPLFQKPLRALPYQLQIGYIDAVTYCLSLRPPFLDFNDELIRFLHETQGLVDADDAALGMRSTQYKAATGIVNMRASCIRLLSAAMSRQEFAEPAHQEARSRILASFFRLMQRKSPEIKDAAYKGLKQILTQQHPNGKLPKELIQSALKPILMIVSDARRLTVSGLECLVRLMEVMTNYFRAEIGVKLIKHLDHIAQTSKLYDEASRPLSEIPEAQLICAGLEVYRLLPTPETGPFLDDLVCFVLQLEKTVRRNFSSPFRQPLLKYCNRFASLTVEYFMTRLADKDRVRFFIGLIGMPDAGPLRHELMHEARESIETAISHAARNISDTIQVLPVVHLLVTHHPDWINQNSEFLDRLIAIWIERDADGDFGLQAISTSHMHELKMLCEMLLSSLRNKGHDSARVFTLVDLLVSPHLTVDTSFATEYVEKEIVSKCPEEDAVRLCHDFFTDSLRDESRSIRSKAYCLRLIVAPLFSALCGIDSESLSLVPEELVSLVALHVWNIPSDDMTAWGDALWVEFIKLTAICLDRAPGLAQPVQHGICSFAAFGARSDDATVKQAALNLLSRATEVFGVPSDDKLRLFNVLIETYQAETKSLGRQAVEKLLCDRDWVCTSWIGILRRFILEDSGTNPSLPTYLYTIVVDNAGALYQADDCQDLVGHLVSILPKLGYIQSSTTEARLLSIRLADVVLTWLSQSAAGEDQHHNFRFFRKSVAQFLAQMMINKSDAFTKLNLPRRALTVFRKHFDKTGMAVDATVRATLEQSLRDLDLGEQARMACVAIQVLKICGQSDGRWASSALVASICERAFQKDPDWQLCAHIAELVNATVSRPANSDAMIDVDDDSTQILSALDSILQETSITPRADAGPLLMLLHAVADARPAFIDSVLQSLKALFQRLVTEHIRPPASSTEFAHASTDGQVAISIVSLLTLIKSRIGTMGEHRKTFLNCLPQLFAESRSRSLLEYLLGLVTSWVWSSDGLPTLKDKSQLLLSIKTVELRDSSLLLKYLELVASIYESDEFKRTELTVRLEPLFFTGFCTSDHTMRRRFQNLLGGTINPSLQSRLHFVFGVQNWEFLMTQYWITPAIEFILSASNDVLRPNSSSEFRVPSFMDCVEPTPSPDAVMVTDMVSGLVNAHAQFMRSQDPSHSVGLIDSVSCLLYADTTVAHQFWTSLFPNCLSALSTKEKHDFTKEFIPLLAKPYHVAQRHSRPNVISTLLEGALRCSPPLRLPPQVLKYLGKTHNAWYSSLLLTEHLESIDRADPGTASSLDEPIRESALDALAELYENLIEDDMYFGLWRRRATFTETIYGMSFEQHGMCSAAQACYEAAQTKARNGNAPFAESEYNVWEKRWLECTMKLQHWDILLDLAKHENNPELLVESSWRLADNTVDRETFVNSIHSLQENPRYTALEAFSLLPDIQSDVVRAQFQRFNERGIKLALDSWHSLPSVITSSHDRMLHCFQQLVELQEACQVFVHLFDTNIQNFPTRHQEVKSILTAWRERLPTYWDDINVWSDLVSWRTLVFNVRCISRRKPTADVLQMVNKIYVPLVPQLSQPPNATPAVNSFVYRGYHEMAWIINRFAHIARKHGMLDVCSSQLTKIYTLPNIEIQEAFVKLKEQAKCHYESGGNDLTSGLDVISSTNLMYFTHKQKSDFFTLKGKFLSRLSVNDEAYKTFSAAAQYDLGHAPAWAAWAQFQDKMFREHPSEIGHAVKAVDCYLQASSLVRTSRSRRYIARILWLLSVDDQDSQIAKAFESFRGEIPLAQWLPFIPQMITALGYRESPQVRLLLMKISKSHPQAIHYHLRAAREEMEIARGRTLDFSSVASTPLLESVRQVDVPDDSALAERAKTTWDHIDEISTNLKTGFPLLVLNMQRTVDQIIQRLRLNVQEDTYRVVSKLLFDSIQLLASKIQTKSTEFALTSSMIEALRVLSMNLQSSTSTYKSAFDSDFLGAKPLTLHTFVERLHFWKHQLEYVLDRRPSTQSLETFSTFLVEFEHMRFDEVDIPGQSVVFKDNIAEFVRIQRFEPQVSILRNALGCGRRLGIRGHNGIVYYFLVQQPVSRHPRRDERVLQFFRSASQILDRAKDAKRRRLDFYTPGIIPLSSGTRLIQTDSSMISLESAFEQQSCKLGREYSRAAISFLKKLSAGMHSRITSTEMESLRLDIMEHIAAEYCPADTFKQFVFSAMTTPLDYWLFRKRFTSQLASSNFMAFLFGISGRDPSRMMISMQNGRVFSMEQIPSVGFSNTESVPFRLTPNLQEFIGPVGTEGVYLSAFVSIAKCLLQPENEMADFLSLFVRDEYVAWSTSGVSIGGPLSPTGGTGGSLAQPPTMAVVEKIVDDLVIKVRFVAGQHERDLPMSLDLPADQYAMDLISMAANPQRLASMDCTWAPWL